MPPDIISASGAACCPPPPPPPPPPPWGMTLTLQRHRTSAGWGRASRRPRIRMPSVRVENKPLGLGAAAPAAGPRTPGARSAAGSGIGVRSVFGLGCTLWACPPPASVGSGVGAAPGITSGSSGAFGGGDHRNRLRRRRCLHRLRRCQCCHRLRRRRVSRVTSSGRVRSGAEGVCGGWFAATRPQWRSRWHPLDSGSKLFIISCLHPAAAPAPGDCLPPLCARAEAAPEAALKPRLKPWCPRPLFPRYRCHRPRIRGFDSCRRCHGAQRRGREATPTPPGSASSRRNICLTDPAGQGGDGVGGGRGRGGGGFEVKWHRGGRASCKPCATGDHASRRRGDGCFGRGDEF